MPEEARLEIQRESEGWLASFFKWCPTSPQQLRQAERNILTNLKSVYRGFFVNVGKTVGNEENLLWTLVANEESDKTPIVLIHGFGSGNALWCLNIDSLAENRPVYAFDILGFGRSSRPQFNSEAIEAEGEFINSIEAWRKEVKIQKFILLGHSFGGFLSASYAIKYPERISHLILADPWGFAERPLDVQERYNLPVWIRVLSAIVQPLNPLFAVRAAGPLGPVILQRARPDLVHKFSHTVENAQSCIPDYLYHCNAQYPSGETAFHSLMMRFGWAKYPMIHRMESLRKEVPITLIYGARSWIDRDPGFQIKYMRQQSYVDVQIIQGAGHHVYADRAPVFNGIINTIGNHTDEGTLPPLSTTQTRQDKDRKSFSMFDVVHEDFSREESEVSN